MSNIFSALRVTASALTAQRLRMDVTASNIANAETTRTAEGGPYRRRVVVFAANPPAVEFGRQAALQPASFGPTGGPAGIARQLDGPGRGVRVEAVVTDGRPGQRVYDPSHPDADQDGYVTYPNVNVVTEMADMLSATRSYEANVTVFNALKSMALKALDLGRG